VSTRTALSRPTIIFVAIAALALSMLYLISPVSADAGYTPGSNGHPTNGPYSNLNGGVATFTFEQNAVLSCNGDTATSFSFTIDYTVTGTLPANSTLIIYLSPNQGAINNNAGGDAAGYIATVESNYFSKNVSGLTGSGSFDVTVTVSAATSFDLAGGGVLGVFASEAGATGQSWDSKSNSVQCSEAQSVPPSTEGSVLASASAPASVPPSAEGSVKAGTGTPAASTSNTALFGDGSNPLPTIAFSLILLASLGGLAFANVKTVRRRI
jgi:hypothetical protein